MSNTLLAISETISFGTSDSSISHTAEKWREFSACLNHGKPTRKLSARVDPPADYPVLRPGPSADGPVSSFSELG